MAVPELAPQRRIGAVIVVWAFAALAGIAIGLFVEADARASWLLVALAGSLVLSFGVQLGSGRADGFISRVALSAVGALLVLGVISLGFGLAAVVPG